jgi:hypothetical protein
MTIVRIRREEMALVKAAGERVARRTHARFVVDQSRVEITEDDRPAKAGDEEAGDTEKPLDLR